MTAKMILLAAAMGLGAVAAHAQTTTDGSRAGYDRWNAGDYFGAVDAWRPLALAGNADAQYNLGQAYKLGRGVPVDLKMAESWYGRAAAQGHVEARDNYGLMLFQNGDRQTALPYIRESSDRGEPRAQYVLATAMFNGDLVTKDWVRAYALMTRASAAGIAAASSSLAQMDRFIPLDQRQRGLTLARELEVKAARPQLAGSSGATRSPGLVGSEALPPSRAPRADTAGAPPVVTAQRPVPVERPAPVERNVEQIIERPLPPRAAPPRAVGNWRVQLGAFSSAGGANAQWRTLSGRIAALASYRPIVAAAGPVTRLQVGGLANRAAAEALCAKVRAGGAACLAVAP